MHNLNKEIANLADAKVALSIAVNSQYLEGVDFFRLTSCDVSNLLASFISAAQVSSLPGKREIKFKNCVFNQFSLSEFNNLADLMLIFESCKFSELKINGEAAIEVIFCSQTKIKSLQAKQSVRAKIKIAESYIGSILFSMATNKRDSKTGEEKQTYVFDSVEFKDCQIGVEQGQIVFRNVKFKAPLSFSGSTFHVAPKFFSAELHEDTDFVGTRFLDVTSYYAMRAYRALRFRMASFHSDYEVQMFHALELETRYNTELPKGREIFSHPQGVETIASWFMRRLNNYGRNLWLPALWLMGAAYIFFLLYLLFGEVGYSYSKEAPKWVETVGSGGAELLYTARNTFGPFGLVLSTDQIQPNTVTVKILGFIHLLISSVIWFIWILQIRSRFKL